MGNMSKENESGKNQRMTTTDEDVQPGQGLPLSGKLVRLFVGGLPLGLVIMGALSFVIWNYKKKEKPPIVLEFASMLQRDVNKVDFDRYVDLITNEIGGRDVSVEEKSEAVASFIESSMGLDNMGYEMRQRKTLEGGWYMYAELPSAGWAKGVLLVVADARGAESDVGKASSLAALMSVAHAMTGRGYGKMVRFAVVSDEAGFKEVAQGVTRVLEISSEAKEGAVVFAEGGVDVTAKLKQLQELVERAAE